MQSKMLNAILMTVAVAGFLFSTNLSNAAEIYLRAQTFDKTLPDGTTVPMWGFASCDSTHTNCTLPVATDAPGPQIDLLATDTHLNIHLQNNLSTPVSIVIPGLTGNIISTPPTIMDSSSTGSRARIRSFTHETAPGTTATYSWSSLSDKAGTYMYQSGTMPSIQIPMGLYGAVIIRPDTVSYSDMILADLPSHYYRLSGNAIDTVTGAIDPGSTYGNAITTGELGYITDKAANFDATSDSFVDTNVTTIRSNDGGEFSVEAWVNANTTAGSNRIVAKDEIGVQGHFILWFQNGNLRFQVRPSSTTWVTAQAPVTPPEGTTFHVAGVFDGTDVILYVNGDEVDSVPLGATTTNVNNLPITIGADSDNVNGREHIFDGTIDEVAIYESALSATQINNHFNANKAETVMLFSEIDPVQNARANAAVAIPITNTCTSLLEYKMNPVVGYPCTVDYNPTTLLVNGGAATALRVGNPGGAALLRLINAGLLSHAPSLVGIDMGLIAEDGHPYPGNPRMQSTVLLAAGKTMDAIISMPEFMSDGTSRANTTLALFDRMPSYNSGDPLNEGMLVNLQVGSGTPAIVEPSNFNENYSVTEDTPLIIDPTGGNGVYVVSQPENGTLVENPIPAGGALTYTYTPNPDFSGQDMFVYRRQIGHTYYATLNVSFENDAPEATADTYGNNIGTEISVAAPGILGNDADIDGDTLSVYVDPLIPLPAGLTLETDGSFTYTGGITTSFQYSANDGDITSPAVTVELNVSPVSGRTLTVQDPDGTVVTNYRWLVQEDPSYQVDPLNPPAFADSLALNFHKSSAPVVAQGHDCAPCDAGNPAVPFGDVVLDPTKHYFVSVLPNSAGTGAGHTLGGAQVLPNAADPTATNVTVIVNKQKIPTAKISVLTFEDHAPTNGVPDAGENMLGGFQIILEDAGGRYGASGGPMLQDAFGEPLKNSMECFEGGALPPAGIIVTCPDTPANQAAGIVGQALITDLVPGKYGVISVAPANGTTYTQTSTIEGSKVIDAWVKAGGPPFFTEFGQQGFHAFFGFVDPAKTILPVGVTGTNTVSGQISMFHDPRPPGARWSEDTGSYDALGHTRAWIGLNSLAGNGPNLTTVHADSEGNFTMNGIPDGTYQLAIWDDYLDQIIHFRVVNLPADNGVHQQIPVNNWFTRAEHTVFLDENENGVLDPGEEGDPSRSLMIEQAINLRWRDGTVNQSFPTDLDGAVPFDQIFPFFSWQVFEVDYTRFKATGLTVTVDAGGDTSTGPYPGLLNPQIQADSATTRTEIGPVLSQGFQGFPGQTSIFHWGKKPYAPGENGGISGIVFYGSTRGENDPRFTVGDPWEPGIASVKLRLYREVETASGEMSLALVQETLTDSWDATPPTGCPGEDPTDAFTIQTLGIENIDRCYDHWRNWNQVRPGVFDGGYAFNDIPPGRYVVEVVLPQGYELIKEEDLNVGFGDSFGDNGFAPATVTLPNGMIVTTIPNQADIDAANSGAQPGLAQPACVGQYHVVPEELSLFPGTPAPFAEYARPLCDRKVVTLSDQGQAAADFHLFTSTPVASTYTGLITDDLANGSNPTDPGFGEKWSPAYMPFAIRDFTGREVYRGYSDAFGKYNGMLPSTFTANVPIPSGYSPAMMSACLNDPGDGAIQDPNTYYAYSTACYPMQFMPGTTTYLDTPVLPTAAFSAGFNPPDCALPTNTPMINYVNRRGLFGPWLNATASTNNQKRLVIRSEGRVDVPNPAYEGPFGTEPSTIRRDYRFGSVAGEVFIGDVQLDIIRWRQGRIDAQLPEGCFNGGPLSCSGELRVIHDNGNSSLNSVTVTVSADAPIRVASDGSGTYTTIQEAIDAPTTEAGDLILVKHGVYKEKLIMWKPVRLQGSGAGGTIIDAVNNPIEKLEIWKNKLNGLVTAGSVDLLPGQDTVFGTEQGGAITVLSQNNGSWNTTSAPRIDGFTITGADGGGGGIFINGYAHNLEISNNDITGNKGNLHGGIRVGHPNLPLTGNGPFAYNTNLSINNNTITHNGAHARWGAGGGISLSTGSDDYDVSENLVCGNFTLGDGAGIAHLGLSDNGTIESNQILFNQSINLELNQHGGGLFIGGESSDKIIPGEPLTTLSRGTGNVVVNGNLIQGNIAATGHGGGIRTQLVNGIDAQGANPWTLNITNNMIVNNLAGWSGAGISLQDTAYASILNNTIANNDSTATIGGLVINNVSTPQPAGISSDIHSVALNMVLGTNFSNPTLVNNIIWHNRAFYYDATAATPGLQPVMAPTEAGGCDASANYWDLGVLGEQQVSPTQKLNPIDSVLTNATGYNINNLTDDPDFVSEYCNGDRKLSIVGPIPVNPALGEGGNFLDLRYGPLTRASLTGVAWDYHIGDASSGLNNGNATEATNSDFDNEVRPMGQGIDRGADEYTEALPPVGLVVYSAADFGEVFTNQTATLTVTATVSGADVTFGQSTDPLSPFAKTADTCSNTTVVVGGTCEFTVTYTPTIVATDAGTIEVPIDVYAAQNPIGFALSGAGILPPGTAAFTSVTTYTLDTNNSGEPRLNYGTLENGRFDSFVTITVTDYPVTFGNLSTTRGRFSISPEDNGDSCSGMSLAVGDTCIVRIVFNARGNRWRTGRLIVPNDSIEDPIILRLRGR